MHVAPVLTSLQDIITAAEDLNSTWLGEIWWRGHSSSAFVLQAGVHRAKPGLRYEQNLTLRFRQYAPTQHSNCPTPIFFVSWLFLMQHYGLPTRLLDWSASVLIGTFFAVSDRPNEDGVVFAIDPRKLNKETNGDLTLVPPTSSRALQIFTGAFDDRQKETNTIAVMAHEIDNRMLVQQARFTIHGREEPLDGRSDVNNFLRRFTIPASEQKRLHLQLHNIGFQRSTIFPDLTNLALDLKDILLLP